MLLRLQREDFPEKKLFLGSSWSPEKTNIQTGRDIGTQI